MMEGGGRGDWLCWGRRGGSGRVCVVVRVVISPRLFLYLFLSSGELGHFYYWAKGMFLFFP